MKVAWCSYFPVEWLEDAPEAIRQLPKRHPAPWLRVGVEDLAKLPDLDLHVIDLCKGLPTDLTFQRNGVTFHCLKVPGGMRAPSLFWLDTFLIGRRLKQIRPDVLHAWGTEKGAALVASRLRYPYLVTLQGVMGIYCRLTRMSNYERFAARLERISLRRAGAASGESTMVVDWIRENHPHLKVHHVEHAPSWMFYDVRREPATRPIQLLCVGGLSVRKGTDLLLLALDKLKDEIDFRLTLIGLSPEPDFMALLKQQTSPALWEKVTVQSGQASSEIAAQLARATIALAPTRADTGPVAVKEAVVAGVPVVGSVMGGIPDYIAPGKNGFLFPAGDQAALTNTIRQACKHPSFQKGRVDEATLADVRKRLSPRRMAEGFSEIYKCLQTRVRR